MTPISTRLRARGTTFPSFCPPLDGSFKESRSLEIVYCNLHQFPFPSLVRFTQHSYRRLTLTQDLEVLSVLLNRPVRIVSNFLLSMFHFFQSIGCYRLDSPVKSCRKPYRSSPKRTLQPYNRSSKVVGILINTLSKLARGQFLDIPRRPYEASVEKRCFLRGGPNCESATEVV